MSDPDLHAAISDYKTFWSRIDLSGRHYIHPDDEYELQPKKRQRKPSVLDGVHDFKSYLESRHFNCKASDGLAHPALIPQPHIGDLANAKVLVLMKNPGFHVSDYWAEENSPAFRGAIEANLRLVHNPQFPFLFLNPEFCWHGGYKWWEGKLHSVVAKLCDERFSGQYAKALSYTAKSLAALEIFPYHSKSGFDSKLLDVLPSAVIARRVARAFANSGRKIVVARCVSKWGLPDFPNVICYEIGEARSASLSTKTSGGLAILEACR